MAKIDRLIAWARDNPKKATIAALVVLNEVRGLVFVLLLAWGFFRG